MVNEVLTSIRSDCKSVTMNYEFVWVKILKVVYSKLQFLDLAKFHHFHGTKAEFNFC